jgi:hypothetical protein
MAPSPRVWLATFLTLVFLIGGMTGVVIDRVWLLRPRDGGPALIEPGRGRGPGMRGGGPGMQDPERVVSDLDELLTLTDDQESAILKILEGWRPRVQEVQNATRQQFIEMQRQLRQEIATTLTPEQRERFERTPVDQLDRGPRGGGGPDGRGPRGRGR